MVSMKGVVEPATAAHHRAACRSLGSPVAIRSPSYLIGACYDVAARSFSPSPCEVASQVVREELAVFLPHLRESRPRKDKNSLQV